MKKIIQHGGCQGGSDGAKTCDTWGIRLCFTSFMSWPQMTKYLHNLPTPRSPGKKTHFDVPLTGALGPNQNWDQA